LTRLAISPPAIEALHAATALYTAEPVVEVLIDRIGWPDADGRLVDPSAGDGMFMVRALSRLDLAPDIFPGSRPCSELRASSWCYAICPGAGAIPPDRQRLVDRFCP